MSLKQQTISGITWSFIDNSFTQIVTFAVGIILARLLTPAEFGLVGMIAIFIAIAQTFVDSGFSQALIRKKDCSDKDYNTVFYFSLAASVFFYFVLFLSAGLISDFFNETKLEELVKVLGLSIIINALGIIHLTQLNQNIEIKVQTKISVIANISSGVISIYMAYTGFGVWSLVWRTIFNNLFRNLLLWYYNKWRPKILFSLESFKSLFSFGSKLLISGLLNTIFENLYYFVIGKYFSAQQLGYYTRADTFARLPSSNINGIVQRVSYPVLAKLQDDPVQLKYGLKKLIQITMYITFILMFLMAAVAEPLIISLIGIKWMQTIPYLQLLCFALVLYPLHSLNLNLLNVKGRSDLFLKLEIIKKIAVIPFIIVGVIYGIEALIVGIIVHSFFAYFLNTYYTGKLIDYGTLEQIRDILPSFIIASIVGTAVFILGHFIKAEPAFLLIIQSFVGAIFVVIISELFKLNPYLEIKEIITSKFIDKYKK
jgi:teichuronic acid exporter